MDMYPVCPFPYQYDVSARALGRGQHLLLPYTLQCRLSLQAWWWLWLRRQQ
jgi:hypothetical protein